MKQITMKKCNPQCVLFLIPLLLKSKFAKDQLAELILPSHLVNWNLITR